MKLIHRCDHGSALLSCCVPLNVLSLILDFCMLVSNLYLSWLIGSFLFTLLKVWIDAAAQVLYSLAMGMGVNLTFASYNNKHNNILK